MKRLNPKTGKPFKQGDLREDGYIFRGYSYQHISNSGYFYEVWKNAIQNQIQNALSSARSRSKQKKVAFDLDKEYLESIMTSLCPVFGIILSWGVFGQGHTEKHNSPSLDRIIPELGYIKGNVVFISGLANTIKQDVTEEELYKVADWLHKKRKEVLHAFQDQLTPVPAGSYPQSEEHTKHGIIPAPGAWEDNYDANHHRGAVYGEDPDHSAQASSGDSVAHRNRKVEPSRAFESREDDGDSVPAVGGTQFTGGRVFD